MTWVTVSLLAAAVTGVVNIFDKTVIHHYARTPWTLPLLIGIAQTASGLVVLAIVRVPAEATFESVGWSLVSGLLFGLGAQFLMRVLYSQEVSRAIPVYQTAPIFTALLAAAFLGEELTLLQWGAILATVLGAVALSGKGEGGGLRATFNKALALLLIGAFISGTAHIFGKVAVDQQPVLFTHGLRMLALGLVFLAFNLRPVPYRDLRRFFGQRSPALLMVGTNELVLANAGLILMLWALSLGPASLVTALVSTRSFFTVVYSIAVALAVRGALGEQVSPKQVAGKLAATGLIVVGVIGIAVL